MDINEILNDPDFIGLPDSEKQKVLMEVDPDFVGLPAAEQKKVLLAIQPREPGPVSQTDTGGFGETLLSGVPDIKTDGFKRTASALYRPMLEGGGAVAGGLLAGQGLPTPQTLIGGGLGYAAGRNIADRLDEMAGISEPMSLKDIAKKSAVDVPTGAALEAGGQAIAVAARPVFLAAKRAGRWVVEKTGIDKILKAATQSGAEREASAILKAHTTDGDIYAINAEDATALEQEIPGLKFSLAEKRNDPNLIKLQRAQERTPGSGANLSLEKKADNTEALRRFYDESFSGPEGIDDLNKLLSTKKQGLESTATRKTQIVDSMVDRLPTTSPQESGQAIVGNINKAKEPVKKAMSALKAEIPDYPMTFNNMKERIHAIKKDPQIPIGQKKAVEAFETDLNEILKHGQSTHTAVGIRRTLNNTAEKYFKSGDSWSGKILNDVRTGLEADLDEVTKLARTGKVAEYKGRTVNPDSLAAELEQDTTRLAKLSQTTKPDIQAMQKALQERSHPSLQVVHEGDKEYFKRLERSYKQIIGDDIPYTSDKAMEATVSKLKERIAVNKGILENVSPGQDVAASMKAYNDFASTEYFRRFDKGAIKQATARGSQIEGTRSRIESIPSFFTTASGADDLIRAVGEDAAAGIMKGHFAYDMLQSATNPSTGKVVETKLSKWLLNNKAALRKYGIDNQFANIRNAQATADAAQSAVKDFERSAAQRILNADPEKAIASAIKGNNTGQVAQELIDTIGDNPAARKGLQRAFADHIMTSAETTARNIKDDPVTSVASLTRLIKKYRPAMRVLYKDEPQKLKALENMQKAYQIMSRSSHSPLGGGSDTNELLTTFASVAANMSFKARLAKNVVEFFDKIGQKRANEILNRALFDPDGAMTIKSVITGKVNPAEIETVLNNKIINLNDYRTARTGQVAAGLGAVAYGDSD